MSPGGLESWSTASAMYNAWPMTKCTVWWQCSGHIPGLSACALRGISHYANTSSVSWCEAAMHIHIALWLCLLCEPVSQHDQLESLTLS